MDKVAIVFPYLLEACRCTIALFCITAVFSFILGLGVMKLRESENKIISMITRLYILVMRGTPLVLQLIFFYFAPYYLFGVTYDRFLAASIALVFNYTAYFAEIFRGGIKSVDIGQFEAAKALGMSSFQTFRLIIYKQMIKPIIPTLCNEFMTLVKDTSLVQVIAVAEIFGTAQKFTTSMSSIIPIVVAGVFYLVMNMVVEQGFAFFEKRYSF